MSVYGRKPHAMRRVLDELAYQQDDGEWVAKRTAHDLAAFANDVLDEWEAAHPDARGLPPVMDRLLATSASTSSPRTRPSPSSHPSATTTPARRSRKPSPE